MENIELGLDFKPTKGAPYLAISGEVWGVYCEN